MADFLSSDDVRETYEAVVVDTAPSKGPLTVSVIKAATHIIIPSVMEEQPVQGIYGMLQLWMQESLIREKNRPLTLVGILPTMYKKQTRLHRDLLNSLQDVMPVKICERIVFAEMDSENANPHSIFDFTGSHVAKDEAIEVCQHIFERIFNHD